jgi:hypothetical protein
MLLSWGQNVSRIRSTFDHSLFQQQPQIDSGGGKIRLQRQHRAIRQDRLAHLAAARVFHAEVEPGGIENALPARLRGDPAPVQLDNGRLTAIGANAFGRGNDLVERRAFQLRQKRGLGHDALRFSRPTSNAQAA